jgi:hypothetical protein
MKCPACGTSNLAYIGFTSIECLTPGCVNQTKQPVNTIKHFDLKGQLKNIRITLKLEE